MVATEQTSKKSIFKTTAKEMRSTVCFF